MTSSSVGSTRAGSEANPNVDPGLFRSFMATFPTGVAVVTATAPGRQPWGLTCSSVCSVAADPPTLLVCLRQVSPTLTAILTSSMFAVNLLHVGGRAAAELFASGDPDRFDRVRWEADPVFGSPHLTDDAHAIADCQITRTVVVGPQIVVFGAIRQLRQNLSASAPLLYGLRQYSSWSG